MPDLKTDAVLTPKTNARGRELSEAQQRRRQVQVHFNPETLELTLTNTLQKGRRRRPAQTVTESTAKLSMDLIFDTTMTGEDVRTKTHEVAQMMDPVQTRTTRGGRSREGKVPSIVIFEWATIKFEGYIDSYKESIDFFSSQGIPLRATISLSLTQQERTFAPTTGVDYDQSGVLGQPSFGNGMQDAGDGDTRAPSPDAQTKKMATNETVTQAAQAAGDPGAARRLGIQNGIENLRRPDVEEIAISGDLIRNAAGFSTGISAGVSFSASVGAPGALITQKAALSTTTGSAFAKLHLQAGSQVLRPRTKLSLDTDTLLGANIGIGKETSFGIGGEITGGGGTSVSADVGVKSDFEAGIIFEE